MAGGLEPRSAQRSVNKAGIQTRIAGCGFRGLAEGPAGQDVSVARCGPDRCFSGLLVRGRSRFVYSRAMQLEEVSSP